MGIAWYTHSLCNRLTTVAFQQRVIGMRGLEGLGEMWTGEACNSSLTASNFFSVGPQRQRMNLRQSVKWADLFDKSFWWLQKKDLGINKKVGARQ